MYNHQHRADKLKRQTNYTLHGRVLCEDPTDQHSDPRNIRSYSVHTLTNTHNVPTNFKSVA